MLKVVIEPSQVKTVSRSGVSASGRQWQIRSQECWIYSPNSSFPRLYAINVPDDMPVYPAGDYLLDVESLIQPNDFNGLSLSRNPTILIVSNPEQSQKPDPLKKFGAQA